MTEKDIMTKTVFSQAYQGSALFDKEILSHILGSCKITGTTTNYAKGNEDAKKAKIDDIQDYGQYTVNGDPIRFFDVTLNDLCNITHARVNIQLVLRKLWKDNYSGMVLVFHYASTSQRADKDTWRFSWVERKTSGTTTTPGKRYTYLCGPAYSCRTIAERFDVLQNTQSKTLDSITAAFDVEALSDEFFYNFRALYSKIQSEGEKGKSKYKRYKKLSDIPENELGFCDFIERYKEDNKYFASDFAKWDSKVLRDYIKKMMGRLVFLQFLQKKGWMCGNPNYLKSLFEKFVQGKREEVTDIAHGSFLDEVLEPLFFGVLNTKAKDRKDLFKNKKWNLDLLNEWKDIPYLNGGLFEQEVYDKPKSAFPNVLFNELFTLFSEYNFTIDENDPDDKEVGIDPEMLSKIFESQLEDNKDKGAFYTPKEIVEYMCKESLIAYLQTDITDEGQKENIRSFVCDREAALQDGLRLSVAEKLKNVKICDPAIGSGAFPMGMLNLLVSTREKIESVQNRLELKKEIICNNLYGVDIEKGAVDIARLRFWLSLVIDEDEPAALPNLDYKIMQGNSLLEQYEGVELSGMSLNEQAKSKVKKGQSWQQTLVFDEQGALDNIQNAIRESFATEDHEKKSKFREIINENIKNYICNLKGCTSEIQQKLTQLPIPNDKFFLWHIYFKEVFDKGGFDIVIGNPPYGAKLSNEDKKTIKASYESAKTIQGKQKGSLDTFSLFIERGYVMSKNCGITYMIVPLSITASDAMSGIHNLLLSNCDIIRVSSYGDRPKRIFESAEQQVAIISFRKTGTPCRQILTTSINKRYSDESLWILLDNLRFTNSLGHIRNGRIPKLGNPIEAKILSKLAKSPTELGSLYLNEGSPIYYRKAGGRYYKLITTKPTYSSAEGSIEVEPIYRDAIAACMSTTLYYWFWLIHSDWHNMRTSELAMFPIPKKEFTQPVIEKLKELYYEYLDDLYKNSKTMKSGLVCFYARKSKALIDKIDRYVGKLYGLNDEEIEFIINYDIAYRNDDE